MKRYEGLFILDTAAKEEGIKDAIDRISAEITTLGGKIETVQKMDKKSFSRVANKAHSADDERIARETEFDFMAFRADAGAGLAPCPGRFGNEWSTTRR